MALLSIQAAKGVGLGDGFDLAGRPGSEAHDEIFYSEERGYFRETNRSGGLEGGMTTGEPLVARVAMKPIPTLTKPLRSVDISTKEPAQALRERTDSCVVPAAGVVGEAMLAIVLAGAYRDKFGGDHIDDVRATVDAYCRADRVEAPALVFIGFMGAGKTTGARAAAAALGVRAIDTDRELEQRLGTSIEDYFASHGERAFREAEEDVVAEVLETPPAPVISIGGGAIGSARVRELLARHTVVMLDVDEATAWRRAGGKRRPLARDRERFAALHAERAPVYEALADAVLLDGGAETVRRAAGALRKIPTGVKVLWAVAGERQLPGLRRRRARRLVLARARPALPDLGRQRRRALRRPDPGRGARAWRWPPGEAAKTLTTAETLLRGLAGAGHGPRRPRGGARRRRGRRRRRLLRRGLPARRRRRAGARRRSSPRSTRPTAARPGWTCPRARTTSAPTTSRARCSPIRARSRRCRRRSSRRAGPRSSRPR